MAPKSRPTRKRKRRTYSDAERIKALDIYELEGPTAVFKQLGIPKSTVARWAKEQNVGTVRNKKTEAATKATEVDAAQLRAEVAKLAISGGLKAAKIMLKRLDNEDDISTKDLVPLFGVLVDKNIALTKANEGAEQHNDVDAYLAYIMGGGAQ
jgi:transposase-like protein